VVKQNPFILKEELKMAEQNNLENVFGQSSDMSGAAEVASNAEKKEKIKKMKESLKETLSTDASFASRIHTLSQSIEVVNTLGYGKGGNIVVDKKASSADNRVLKPTSAICGYRLKNIGDTPIEYTTEEYTQDETGKFVGSVVTKSWAPGTTIDLTRQYTTMLCSIPEISFVLANGKIVASSRKASKKGTSLKDELASYYFSFDKNGEDGPQVNDDEVKLSVDDANGKVKAEFVATFGYLNNPKEGRVRAAKGQKFSTQDMAANYIQKLLKEQGM
jgi:hypothetical protein